MNTNNMDKTTQLFIRACKSNTPYIRLHSVYRRFYMDTTEDVATLRLSMILADIVDEYCKTTTASLLVDVLGHNYITNDMPIEKRTLLSLCGKIQNTKYNKFKGLSRTCWYKNKYMRGE